MIEKRGVIEEGRTPPERPAEKEARDTKPDPRALEEHLTKRAADAAKDALRR